MSPETLSSLVPRPRSSPLQSSLVQWPTDEALSRLYEELVATALQVSLTGAIAIALSKGASGLHREAIARYLPSRPSVLPFLATELATIPGGSETASLLTHFDERLVALKAQAAAFGSTLADDAFECRSPAIASQWRALAGELRSLLAHLAEFRPTAAGAAHGGMARVALAQLEAVAEGQAPFVDDNGRLVVPLVAERRNRARSSVSKHVFIAIGDSIQRVLVKDVATRGIGVWGLRGAAIGDKVRIMVAPGREIEGEVVWFEGLRAGIRLDESGLRADRAVREIVLGADVLEH